MRLSSVHRILVILITVLCGFTAYGVPSTRFTNIANNNYLHLGLEWQAMKGLSGYYNNARFRDALLAGMFYQQDPLAEKYYPFSPYHYGAGNPLKYVDFDGRRVVSSKENSTPFNMRYGEVERFLKKHDLYQQIQEVKDSEDYIITVKDASGDKKGSRYDYKEQILYIDLNHFVEHENGANSPAFVLRHEFDHVHSHMTDPVGHEKRIETSDENFKNQEEKRVMTQGDKVAAEKLNEPTRTNHSYKRLTYTTDPTLNKVEKDIDNK